MFAYMIIGVELAIIYAVFWYVFLREPKSNNNKVARRGSHSQDSSAFTAYGARHRYSASQSSDRAEELSNHSSCLSQANQPEFSRENPNEAKAECSCSVVSSKRRGRHLRLAWLPADALPPTSSIVDRLCHYLGRKLIQFSLKSP
jgi:hypothetical protein